MLVGEELAIFAVVDVEAALAMAGNFVLEIADAFFHALARVVAAKGLTGEG